MITKLETPTHRIAVNFQTVGVYRQTHRNRPCREKCNKCGRKWEETGTAFVHLATRTAPQDIGKQEWWCDGCLEANATFIIKE